VDGLQVLVLAHEPAERARPPLDEDVRPLEVDGGHAHPREPVRLRAQPRAAVGRGDEVDERAAVRVNEGAADRHGAAARARGGGGGGPAEAGAEERVRERRGGAEAGGGGGGEVPGVVEARRSEEVGGGGHGVRPRARVDVGRLQAALVSGDTQHELICLFFFSFSFPSSWGWVVFIRGALYVHELLNFIKKSEKKLYMLFLSYSIYA
jgi:hypothetical protein